MNKTQQLISTCASEVSGLFCGKCVNNSEPLDFKICVDSVIFCSLKIMNDSNCTNV